MYPYPSHPPPPAAPSLEPMAMSAYAGATGPQVAQPSSPSLLRSRPSAATGMILLLCGVLLGGVAGVGVRARQAAAARPVPKPTPAMTENPSAPAAPASPQAYAGVPFGSLVVTPPASAPPAVVAPSPPKVAPAIAAAPAKPAKAVTTKPAKAKAPAAKEKDDGYKVASAGGDEPKAKPKAEPKPKAEREPAKKAPVEAKTPRPSGDDGADKILKAAMGATENTL